ncbi:MAG: ABC transporter substrate-binding protein [Chloroflexi bacterium]|nr:ABC transporter substrate-binding protein [Chloroflexota bacterium]
MMKAYARMLPWFLVLSFILTACGGAQTTSSTQVAVSETPVEPQSNAGKEAILRVGWASEPDTMNPLTSYSSESLEVTSLIYDKLLGYDLNFKTQPELAQEFNYSEDGLTIIYKLREGVKWQDGQDFSAEDAAYTFNLIKDNELGQYAQWLSNMVSAIAEDPTTFVVTFDKPQAFNPGLAIPILPKHIWESMSAEEIETFPNDKPIGTGPYKFVDWQVGTTLTIERYDEFWGDKPAADKIVYILYGNEDVMAQALKSGDIDIITEVPPTIWDGLADAKNVKAVSLPSFSFHHIGINVSEDENSPGNPLLKDKAVRQALSYALDRNQLVEVALAGHGKPGDSILPIGITDWYLKIPADKQMNANPEKAQQILEEAGYKDANGDGIREDAAGNPLEFRLIAIETTSVDVRAAQLFRDSAAAVGIKLDLQTLDENTLGELVYNVDNPDWDIFVWGWDSGVVDPNYMLGVPLCDQIGGNNDIFYCNEEYDALYEKQATTIDVAARKELVNQMQLMFYDDAAYLVMWYQDKLQAYRTDTWSGWTEIPGGLIYNLTRENYLRITPVK